MFVRCGSLFGPVPRMNGEMEWTANAIFSFVNDLERLPILWDSRIPQHKMGKRKSDVWMQLAIKYKCTPDELKRKWQSLQAAYRREKMREISSGGQYKSRWFAYSSMSFVGDRYRPRKIVAASEKLEGFEAKEEVRNEEEQRLTGDDEPTLEEEQEEESQEVDVEDMQPNMEFDSEHRTFIPSKIHDFKKMKLQYRDEAAVNESYNTLKQTTIPELEERNECVIFGEYVTKKLSKFDDHLSALVQHEIHNILFQAEMGYLTDVSLSSQNSFITSDLSTNLNSVHSPSSTSHHTNVYEIHRPQ
ncbi:hypothetical protein R5R35_000787 [Gryllus longicercus]|uniref:MADF domain-containing protein n=1 Tax=Gryllus longicercus TaxID=2509291 RepID=A0AAN9Z5N8_9ORTH